MVLTAVAAIALVVALLGLPFAPDARREAGGFATYTQHPISFIENRGQVEGPVAFYVHEPAAAVFFTPGGPVISLAGGSREAGLATSLRVEFAGANTDAPIESVEPAPGIVNVIRGADPSRWYTNIPTHRQITYRQPWPGIDVHYSGQAGRLESVYEVAPDIDPAAIRLRYSGQDQLALDEEGNLLLSTPVGDLTESAPVLYQEAAGERSYVGGEYVLLGQQTVGFRVGAYDRARPLFIDPTLSYSTYLGGSGSDQGNDIAVDAAGNAYVTGLTTSTNFPTVVGSLQTASGGDRDAFVTKLGPTGSPVYATYLGGSGFDQGNSIAIDASGNAYVAGLTASANFPTLSPLQTLPGGGDDAFVAKLNSSGSGLVYSTYLGGSDDDEANGIALDGSGNAYLTGETLSPLFPTTLGAFQTTIGLDSDDAFVTKLNAAGSTLVYSTFLGGGSGIDEGNDIAVSAGGGAYVTGSTLATDFPTIVGGLQMTSGGGNDAFLTRVSSTGLALIYSTYLGGAGNDHGFGVALDASANAYVAGLTGSSIIPPPGAFQATNGGGDDAFVAKVNTAGSALSYFTYLGGSSGDGASSIALDASANAYVTGSTFSSNFPTASPLQGSGGGSDAFVTELNATGSALVYSTYLGGSGGDRGWGIAVEGANAYVAGSTFSSNFPTANPSQSANAGLGDGFIAKLDSASSPPFTPTPPSVGGIAELPEVAGVPLEAVGSSGTNAGMLVAMATISAAAVVLVSVAWYTRRWRAR